MFERFNILEALKVLAIVHMRCRICGHHWPDAVLASQELPDALCPHCGFYAGEGDAGLPEKA